MINPVNAPTANTTAWPTCRNGKPRISVLRSSPPLKKLQPERENTSWNLFKTRRYLGYIDTAETLAAALAPAAAALL